MRRDIGCEDFNRAKQNREMVTNKLLIKGYLDVEWALKLTPIKQPLPSWVPQGDLPVAHKRELRGYGFHEIKED